MTRCRAFWAPLVLLLVTGAYSRNHLPEGVKKESGKKLVELYPNAIIWFLVVVVIIFIIRDLVSWHPPGDVKQEPGKIELFAR